MYTASGGETTTFSQKPGVMANSNTIWEGGPNPETTTSRGKEGGGEMLVLSAKARKILLKMMGKITESSAKVQRMFLKIITTIKIGTDDIMN